MPTITKEQALKRQASCPAGWKYDWKHYVIWGDNVIRRRIWTDKTHFIEASIEYRENLKALPTYDGRSTYNVPAGHHHIALSISAWTYYPENDTASSSGMGHWENLDNGQHPRKNYKDLCKIAATVTDEMIMNYTADCKDRPIAG